MRAPRLSWALVSELFTAVPADHSPPAAPTGVEAGRSGSSFGARLGGQLLRTPGRVVVACLASVLGPAVVARAGPIDMHRAPDTIVAAEPSVAGVALPVPGDRASWGPVARHAAATCPGLPAGVLVAIAEVESSLGLQTGTSSAGAVGPMQFLPTTWAAYGADGDGDGQDDVMNPVDAVHGAALLLCANGGADPDLLPSALWHYNHSDDYVRQVIGIARTRPVTG